MTEYTNLVCYKTLPIWTADTLPEAFRVRHNTKSGTWAKLTILTGNLTMEFMTDEGEVTSNANYSVDHQPDFIRPKQYHRIAAWSEDLKCQLSFFHQGDSEG